MMVTTLCDNCGASLYPKKECRRDTHAAWCGKNRHFFAALPIATYHYARGAPALCCGPCAAAVMAGDVEGLRRVLTASLGR